MSLDNLRTFITSANELEFLWDYPDVKKIYYVRCTYLINELDEEKENQLLSNIFEVRFGPHQRLPLNDILTTPFVTQQQGGQLQYITNLDVKCRFTFFDSFEDAQNFDSFEDVQNLNNSLGYVDSFVTPLFSQFQIDNISSTKQEIYIHNTYYFREAFKNTDFIVEKIVPAIKEVNDMNKLTEPFKTLKVNVPAGKQTQYDGYVYDNSYRIILDMTDKETICFEEPKDAQGNPLPGDHFIKGNNFLEYDTDYHYTIGYVYHHPQDLDTNGNLNHRKCIPGNILLDNFYNPIDCNYTYLRQVSFTQTRDKREGLGHTPSLMFFNRPDVYSIYLKASVNRTHPELLDGANWVVEHFNDNGVILDPLNKGEVWSQYDENKQIIVRKSLFYITHTHTNNNLIGDFYINYIPGQRYEYEYGNCIQTEKTMINPYFSSHAERLLIDVVNYDSYHQRFTYSFKKQKFTNDNFFFYQKYQEPNSADDLFRLTNFNTVTGLTEDYLNPLFGVGYIYHNDIQGRYSEDVYLLDGVLMDVETNNILEFVSENDILKSGLKYIKTTTDNYFNLSDFSLSCAIIDNINTHVPTLQFSAMQDRLDQLNSYKIVVYNELSSNNLFKEEFDIGYNSILKRWQLYIDDNYTFTQPLTTMFVNSLGPQESYKIKIIGKKFIDDSHEEIVLEADIPFTGSGGNESTTGFFAPSFNYNPYLLTKENGKKIYKTYSATDTHIYVPIKDKNIISLDFNYVYINKIKNNSANFYIVETKNNVTKKHKIKEGELIELTSLDYANIFYITPATETPATLEITCLYDNYFPTTTNFGMMVEKKNLNDSFAGYPWGLYDFKDRDKGIGYLKYSASAVYNNYYSIKNYNDSAISKICLLPSPFAHKNSILRTKFKIDEMKEENLTNENKYYSSVNIIEDYGAECSYEWENEQRKLTLASFDTSNASVFDIQFENNKQCITNIKNLQLCKFGHGSLGLTSLQHSIKYDTSNINKILITDYPQNLVQLILYGYDENGNNINHQSIDMDTLNDIWIDVSLYDEIDFYTGLGNAGSRIDNDGIYFATSEVGKIPDYIKIEGYNSNIGLYNTYLLFQGANNENDINIQYVPLDNQHLHIDTIRISLLNGSIISNNFKVNTLIPKEPSEMSNVDLYIDNFQSIEDNQQTTVVQKIKNTDIYNKEFEGIFINAAQPIAIYAKDFSKVNDEHKDIIYKITRIEDKQIPELIQIQDVDANIVTIDQQNKNNEIFSTDFCINPDSKTLELNNVNATKIYFKHAQSKTYVNCVLKKQ